MGMSFLLLKTRKRGVPKLRARLRMSSHGIDYKMILPFIVTRTKSDDAWNDPTLTEAMRKVEAAINLLTDGYREAIGREQFRRAVNDSLYSNIRTEKYVVKALPKEQEQADMHSETTLVGWCKTYLNDAANGRKTIRGTCFSEGTIRNIRQFVSLLEEYQAYLHRTLDFKDVDMKLYTSFVKWMSSMKQFSTNTSGKHIGTFKTIMAEAAAAGLHSNYAYLNKCFRKTITKTESIYLSLEEIRMIEDVDLSSCGKSINAARDIFLVGIYTGQRISDYNSLTENNIIRRLENGKEIWDLDIIQKKTGKRVSIPCVSKLRDILEKYGCRLPKISDSLLNRGIKEVGRMAGITEKVNIVRNVAGRQIVLNLDKYRLIQSHTARRSYVTNAYLNNIPLEDIRAITGHTSNSTLMTYIRCGIMSNAHIQRENMMKLFGD